jgi:transposase
MRATADLIAAAGSDRLTGVRVIGVDEDRGAPGRVGPAGFVTLIIDLTPTHDQTGLLDLVDGRSATALADWLAAQPASFAQAVEVIGWTGSPATRPPPPRRPLIVGGARRSLSGKGPW